MNSQQFTIHKIFENEFLKCIQRLWRYNNWRYINEKWFIYLFMPQSMLHIASKLNTKNLGDVLFKHFARLQAKDDQVLLLFVLLLRG